MKSSEKRCRRGTAVLVILLVTALVYLPSLGNGFVNWDDNTYVTENARIRDISWKSIRHLFTSTHRGGYEPLTELSFALEYHFFGPVPFVYHFTNLLLHLLNCLLVFWLVLLLADRVGVAFLTALLFGIHPLHVESVAWISERKDVLYGFFFLGSLIAYLVYSRKRSARYYGLSLLLFFLSLLPKPQGLLLPVVLLLLDYLQGRRLSRKAVFEKAPFFLIAIVFLIIAVVGQSSAGQLPGSKLLAAVPYLLNGCYGLVFYLVKLAVPVGLSCLYPFPDGTGVTGLPFFWLSPIVLAAIVAGLVFSGRYTRQAIFAGLFFLITVLLVLQVIRTGPAIAADRYTYIPSIGPLYLAGVGLVWLSRRGFRHPGIAGTVLRVAVVAIIALLSFLTWQRCRVWKDSLALWSDVLKHYPDASLAHNNLGNALAAEGKYDQAIVHYYEHLRLRPGSAESYYNLGNAYAARDRFETALGYYTEALRLKPDYGAAHGNLGAALARQGRIEEAIIHYRRALQLDPGNAEAHNNLGSALTGQGKLEEAILHYTESLRIRPGQVEVHYNLGKALFAREKIPEAIVQLEAALKINPGFVSARKALQSIRDRVQTPATPSVDTR